jgi:hypothetical protein
MNNDNFNLLGPSFLLHRVMQTRKDYIAVTTSIVLGHLHGDVHRAYNTAKKMADVLEKEGDAPWGEYQG